MNKIIKREGNLANNEKSFDKINWTKNKVSMIYLYYHLYILFYIFLYLLYILLLVYAPQNIRIPVSWILVVTAQNVVISSNFLMWNCAFPQNFHARKLDENTACCAVSFRNLVMLHKNCREKNLNNLWSGECLPISHRSYWCNKIVWSSQKFYLFTLQVLKCYCKVLFKTTNF